MKKLISLRSCLTFDEWTVRRRRFNQFQKKKFKISQNFYFKNVIFSKQAFKVKQDQRNSLLLLLS